MPVAVVENATRPEMRVLRSPLAGLGELVARHKVKSPALIIIGEVAAQPADAPLAALALEAIQ
jgi:uroporphyrin-III C-methyltransferase